MDDLVRAVNAIFAIIGDKRPDKLGLEDLRKIFRLGCNALRQALDPLALRRLEALLEAAPTHEKDVRDMLGNVDNFAKFMETEKEALTRTGVEVVTWGRLDQIIRSVREDATKSSTPKFNELVQGINNLRTVVCKIADELERGVAGKERLDKIREVAGAATLAIGGVVVIVFDAIHLSGMAAQASTKLGWEPIKGFLKRFW